MLSSNRMRIPSRPRGIAVIAMALVLIGSAGSAWAIGEPIVDVRVLGAVRTDESTVRSIAGVRIGDTLENETLALVRERLNTTGLFADVNVWWETYGEGVRVNVSVKEKFPWAPVPTGSWSSNNKSIGLVFVHGNLFGWGKQLVVGGRLAVLDSGAVLAYRDPSLFQTWMYWELKGIYQRQIIPEYISNSEPLMLAPSTPWRQTTLDAFGVEPSFGIAWFRRVRTQVSWRIDKVNYKGNELFDTSGDPLTNGMSLGKNMGPATSRAGTVAMGRAALAFDWRAREHAVMTGPALGTNLDLGSPTFGGDYTFWRASAFWEQGIRVFRRHNLVYSGSAMLGHNLPLWWDPTAGGSNLRGYLIQQFRGDSQINAKVEYHFPLFSIGSLDFRGLGFYDFAAIWFRNLPPIDPTTGYYTRPDGDMRTYQFVSPGFDSKRDLHNDVGAGLRFFLRSVAVPLIGIDLGYGLESHHLNYMLVVGA
jgi:outer membrane protein insertion porin family